MRGKKGCQPFGVRSDRHGRWRWANATADDIAPSAKSIRDDGSDAAGAVNQAIWLARRRRPMATIAARPKRASTMLAGSGTGM